MPSVRACRRWLVQANRASVLAAGSPGSASCVHAPVARPLATPTVLPRAAPPSRRSIAPSRPTARCFGAPRSGDPATTSGTPRPRTMCRPVVRRARRRALPRATQDGRLPRRCTPPSQRPSRHGLKPHRRCGDLDRLDGARARAGEVHVEHLTFMSQCWLTGAPNALPCRRPCAQWTFCGSEDPGVHADQNNDPAVRGWACSSVEDVRSDGVEGHPGLETTWSLVGIRPLRARQRAYGMPTNPSARPSRTAIPCPSLTTISTSAATPVISALAMARQR